MSNQYRNKTVVIEAFQMTEARRMDNSEWPAWLHEAWNKNRDEVGALRRANMDAVLPDALEIVTHGGCSYPFKWGDWIIRDVNGEIFPCYADNFAAIYEPVEAGERHAPEQKEPWCPDRCPITMRAFFMWIEHPELGLVPTYGGPYDSYTIPEPSNLPKDGSKIEWHDIEFICHRYDHDEGGWRIDDVGDPGMRIVSEERLVKWGVWDDEPVVNETERCYVLMKRGLFWRPDGKGYTGNIEEAGRYTLQEAMQREYPYDEPVTKHHVREFLEASQ